jgi:hypothetical protein
MWQLWISEMEAATMASWLREARQVQIIWENPQLDTPVVTEGSICFRRQRKNR